MAGPRSSNSTRPAERTAFVMKVLTDKAVQWLQRQPKEKPFFLYFTPVAVHSPVTPDKDLAGKSLAGLYGDWIHELDRSVGRILDTLDRLGVAQETLVIFTSDNGGVKELARTDLLQTKAYNAGLAVNGPVRGGKHHVWEGGFKVPLIVRWPGKAAAGSVSREMISLVDILATTAAIVGEPLPAASQAAEDSRSFLPAILGNPTAPVREDMIVHMPTECSRSAKGHGNGSRAYRWMKSRPAEAHADEFRPELHNTLADPAETKDVSTQHPEIVAELRALLHRYRDGGYSRELPPAGMKPKPHVAELTPLTGAVVLNEPLGQLPAKPWTITRGDWQAKDGGVWGMQRTREEQGATLRVPLAITDGTIQYEIQFNGANRHSLRVEWGGRKGSFRIEVSRSAVAITKNPSQGEGKEATEPISRKRLTLESRQWYPVRITFVGKEATVQVNDTIVKGSHPVLGQPKTAMNFLVIGQTAGFRNVKVVK